ncbi:MAG: hypothetical protein H7X80_06760, partial [bacterium]|nr:hypothetical protein [Candidatus Kapabacteria bacterium]
RSRKGQAQSAPTIADILSNDRPLEAGEHDALDLGSRALHLSAFIRNRKTEPPMTFAVTGKWGSGKSSLMNLLKSDLVRHGHRPVWFNAWHHQGEQHLLAALFENVRRQAIPPIANLLGARFRYRLIVGRFRRFAPWTAPMLLLLVISTGYFIARPDEAERVTAFIGGMVDRVASFFTAEKADDLPTAPDLGGTAAVSVFAGSLIALINLTLRGFIAFGIAPAVMLRKFSEGAKMKDLTEMTGFRFRFQKEFEEVTNALRDTTMVIIIDDLDRCQPANVLEVLEAVNFLVSSGRVHVILGMDKQRVLAYVHEAYSGREPDFADKYLQKLINVEMAIPAPSPEAARAIVDTDLLQQHAGILARRRTVETRLRRVRTALTFALIGSIGLPVYWLAHRPSVQAESATISTAVVAAIDTTLRSIDTAAAVADDSGATDAALAAQQAAGDSLAKLRSELEQILALNAIPIASLSEGDDGSPPWVPFGVPIVLFAIVVTLSLADRPSSNLTDSHEFTEALDIWLPVITAIDNTPRSLKRFVNHVRFLAMQGRVAQPDPTLWEKVVDRFCRDKLPVREQTEEWLLDAHVVAIEAARYLAPNATPDAEWFGPSGPGPVAAAGDGSANALAALFDDARKEHTKRWGRVEFVAKPRAVIAA